VSIVNPKSTSSPKPASSGGYPHIEALFGESSALEVWSLIVETMGAESRFEKGLALLLDGIEARVGG